MRPREPPHRTTQRARIGVRLGNGKRREKIGAEGVKKSGLPQAARLLSFLDSPIFARRGWLCQYFFTPSPHKQSPGRHTEGMTPSASVNCLQHFFTPSGRRFFHFFLVPFLLAVCAPAPGQDQQIFTPRRLARLRSVSEAKISPDGKRVAYVLSVPRKLLKENDGPAWGELHVVDDKGNSRAFVSGSVKVSKVDWTPDGLGVSFLTKRKDDKAKSLYVIAEDGGEAPHETGISGYSWSPDGKQVAIPGVPTVSKWLSLPSNPHRPRQQSCGRMASTSKSSKKIGLRSRSGSARLILPRPSRAAIRQDPSTSPAPRLKSTGARSAAF